MDKGVEGVVEAALGLSQLGLDGHDRGAKIIARERALPISLLLVEVLSLKKIFTS